MGGLEFGREGKRRDRWKRLESESRQGGGRGEEEIMEGERKGWRVSEGGREGRERREIGGEKSLKGESQGM
jgi:hypothetical protein